MITAEIVISDSDSAQDSREPLADFQPWVSWRNFPIPGLVFPLVGDSILSIFSCMPCSYSCHLASGSSCPSRHPPLLFATFYVTTCPRGAGTVRDDVQYIWQLVQPRCWSRRMVPCPRTPMKTALLTVCVTLEKHGSQPGRWHFRAAFAR